MITLPPICFN